VACRDKRCPQVLCQEIITCGPVLFLSLRYTFGPIRFALLYWRRHNHSLSFLLLQKNKNRQWVWKSWIIASALSGDPLTVNSSNYLRAFQARFSSHCYFKQQKNELDPFLDSVRFRSFYLNRPESIS